MHLIAYINDLLILAGSRELILDPMIGVQYLLESLGFIVNIKKSMLTPAQVMAQVIKFLSLSTDFKAMEIRLRGPKSIKFKQLAS